MNFIVTGESGDKMNELILKEMNFDHIVYLYRPNGKGNPGEIKYDLKTNEIHVISNAPDDDTGYFAHKAEKKVKECVNKKNLPMQCIQAWY